MIPRKIIKKINLKSIFTHYLFQLVNLELNRLRKTVISKH